MVGLILGVVFLAIGLVSDGDGASTFRIIGAIALADSVVTGLVALWATRRGREGAAAEVAARTDFATVTVVAAHLKAGTRVNGRHPLTLTVSGLGEDVTRTLYVFPGQIAEPGDELLVQYAPGDPANFVPVRDDDPRQVRSLP